MSDKASGSVSPYLTFSERKSGSQVRFQRKQKLILSTWGQADQKSLYRTIYSRWLSFSAAERKVYDDEAKAKNLRMSGWNLFLKYAMANPKIYLGLVGYWSMNRSGFGTILDISKNGNVGTLKPLYPSNCPAYVESKNEKLLKALSFDGVNDKVDLSTLPTIVAPYSVSLWFYPRQLNKLQAMVSLRGSLFYPYFCFHINNKLLVYAGSEKYRYGNKVFTSGDLNKWWHVVFIVANPNSLIDWKVYLNGANDTGTSGANTGIYYSPGSYGNIGASIGSYFFNGLIDDVRIYNRALGPTEILKLYKLFR